MAQAVASRVFATKRQVQLWTDGGAIRCLPETDRQGRGRQRLYDPAELPYVALVSYLAKFQVQIGFLKYFAEWARHYTWDEPPCGKSGEFQRWCRRALKGEVESYILFWLNPGGMTSDRPNDQFLIPNWLSADDLQERLMGAGAGIVVNVRAVMTPHLP